MKPFLLSLLFVVSTLFASSQSVTLLPPGKYDTKTRVGDSKWEKGDVIVLNDSQYRLSSSNEIGEYRFSVAAQRIFFTSGPLKSAFTKVLLNNKKTVIVFPIEQNQSLGIVTEVWASKQ